MLLENFSKEEGGGEGKKREFVSSNVFVTNRQLNDKVAKIYTTRFFPLCVSRKYKYCVIYQ